MTLTQTCQGKTSTSSNSDTLTITSSGGQLHASTSDGCFFTATAAGQVASESPADQECSPSSSNATLIYSAFAFVVDGTTATLSARGNYTQSVGVACSFSSTGTYTKH